MTIITTVVLVKSNFLKSSIKLLPLVNYSFCCKMSNWQAEKEKFLSLDIKSKRNGYGKFVELKDIPTWPEYVSSRGTNIEKKIDLLPGHRINSSKNAMIADKISFFAGDITQLEVRQNLVL